MNDKKKSFLLYLDTLEILHKLTDEQAGKLLKAFLAYHSEQDLNLDPMLDLVFFSFQAQFERDGLKYNKIVERNKNNGSKGGRPKNPSKPKKPSGLSGNPSKPKKADSDKDSDSDSGKDSDNKVTNNRFAEFWDLYGKKVDSAKCKAKFSKLTSSDIELIFKNLPAYVASQPDKQYRKNPITWLRNKCWNDEVINNDRQINANNAGPGKKLSAYERVKQRNDELYRQPRERELGLGTNDGHLGGAMGEGERGATIEPVDNGTFIDYEQSYP